jgi:predicted metal-dependent hydrolase
MRINIGNELLEVKVARSRRKTWEIRITSERTLQVRGPLKVSDKKIIELLHTKAGWIVKKLEAMRMRPPVKPGRRFADGEPYPYMGDEYPLNITVSPNKSRVSVKLVEEGFLISVPEHNPDIIRSALEQWCRKTAGQVLPERVRAVEGRMGLKCRQVTVKDQKKRWGSCSSLGNINLNWRLILMPPDVMDSVIVHELAHLVHPNHSSHFYGYLGLHNPDHKAHDRWLKEQGRQLFF